LDSSYQPDELDWNIIDILRREQKTNIVVAEQLGLNESTVRQRLRRLKEAGVLTVRALIDPEVLERQQLAVVAVTVTESKLLDEKAREISVLPSVLHVSIVSGQFDLFVEVLVDSNKGLVRFLTEELSAVDGITATQSFVTLKSYNKFV
jgi:Lrp/AsnC family transcriptional regulator, regulator for asnA, asnC and gidA